MSKPLTTDGYNGPVNYHELLMRECKKRGRIWGSVTWRQVHNRDLELDDLSPIGDGAYRRINHQHDHD